MNILNIYARVLGYFSLQITSPAWVSLSLKGFISLHNQPVKEEGSLDNKNQKQKQHQNSFFLFSIFPFLYVMP